MNGDGRRPPDSRGPEGPLGVFNTDVGVVMGMGIFSRSTASAKRSNLVFRGARTSDGVFCPFESGRVKNDVSYIDGAVDHVVRNYSPSKVIVYGPAAAGYSYQRKRMDLVVIIDSLDEDDLDTVAEDIHRSLLLDMGVSADVIVVTQAMFDRDLSEKGMYADKAQRTGYVAFHN